jgi:hypothetical protein
VLLGRPSLRSQALIAQRTEAQKVSLKPIVAQNPLTNPADFGCPFVFASGTGQLLRFGRARPSLH